MTLGQIWSNSITQNDNTSDVKPVTTNESVVNQNMPDETSDETSDETAKYHNYKKGILDKVINGGKLNNESETSE